MQMMPINLVGFHTHSRRVLPLGGTNRLPCRTVNERDDPGETRAGVCSLWRREHLHGGAWRA